MRFCTLADPIFATSSYISLLEKLANNNDESYSLLTPADNREILGTTFYLHPKRLIRDLVHFLTRKQKPDSLAIEILHPLATKDMGTNREFLTLDEFDKQNGISAHSRDKFKSYLEEMPDGYRIINRKVPLTPSTLIEKGYDRRYAYMVAAYSTTTNNSIPGVCTTTTIIPIASNIFIALDSELVKNLSKPHDESSSFEMNLCNDLREAILIKDGFNFKEYPKQAKKWLRAKYPNIPTDALDRIIDVSKPDRCRKNPWWT